MRINASVARVGVQGFLRRFCFFPFLSLQENWCVRISTNFPVLSSMDAGKKLYYTPAKNCGVKRAAWLEKIA